MGASGSCLDLSISLMPQWVKDAIGADGPRTQAHVIRCSPSSY